MADDDTLDLSIPLRIHVVGIGGAGMSAIATVLADMGHHVSGSDRRLSAVLAHLGARGVITHVGHDPAHSAGADLVAVSTAVPTGNPEVVAARAAGVEVVTRARILAAICATRRVVAVAGTHGKTTTSAMLTTILVAAGLSPSWVVGGDIAGLGGGRWDPAGEWMVAEADESDGTFLDLPGDTGLVTSVEPDHLDFYGDEATMTDAYETFLSGCGAARVVCADDPGAARLGRRLASSGLAASTYGTTAGSSFTMSDVIEERTAINFELEGPDGLRGHVDLRVPGLHNARNAAGALAAAVAVGVSFDVAVAGLGRFAGVARRLERLGERHGVTYVDDYAHLPGEVATVVGTVSRAGWSRVVAVFQPHRYTRTAALHRAFADSFVGADLVVVTGIYASGEAPISGVTGRLVADAIAEAHPDIALRYCEDLDDVITLLSAVLAPGDLCLTLGAGDLTEVPARMVAGP
ncbi:MAG: UDP-N-acetylmuramate--L-alanine ligase [Actinomycetota bacterium]|nr:UDP-N-acetylmuramate--L-alanine ligase [Actinomycetota bacterium]